MAERDGQLDTQSLAVHGVGVLIGSPSSIAGVALAVGRSIDTCRRQWSVFVCHFYEKLLLVKGQNQKEYVRWTFTLGRQGSGPRTCSAWGCPGSIIRQSINHAESRWMLVINRGNPILLSERPSVVAAVAHVGCSESVRAARSGDENRHRPKDGVYPKWHSSLPSQRGSA